MESINKDYPKYDVFISYSSLNSKIADTLCYNLENNNIRCWIAHRDIIPGKDYAEAIIEGLNECHVFLLVLSAFASESPQVSREIERAVSKNKKIIAFRIEDFPLNKSLEYALSSIHWLDATKFPEESPIERLITTIRTFLPDSSSLEPVKTTVITKDFKRKIEIRKPRNAPNWMMKTTTGPGKRFSFGMVYDNTKEETVLNGGYGPGIERSPFFSMGPEQIDTWVWDGDKWQLKNIKALNINNHALAYNKANKQSILFGGYIRGVRSNNTYILVDDEWIVKIPANNINPEEREGHTLVYDELRKTLLMFGGLTVRFPGGQMALGDTWEWDGMVWNKLHVIGPDPRWGHKMVYDENYEAILLFGGTNGTKYFDDTWIWEGNLASWKKVNTQNNPSARCSFGLAFDCLNQNTILFGGKDNDSKPLNDLWKWDGENWILLEEHTPSVPRFDSGFTYDIKRNRLVLTGGTNGKEIFQDTWEFKLE
jgi:hypothetical protein